MFVPFIPFQQPLLLTCAVNTISGVSWVAFTPVHHDRHRGALLRCYRSTAGVRMTRAGRIKSAVSRIWLDIYSVSGKKEVTHRYL